MPVGISHLLIAIVVSIFLAGGGTAAYFIFQSGEQKCEIQQAKTQIVTVTKVQKVYEKIDHATPYNASKSDTAKWLLKYTRSSSK